MRFHLAGLPGQPITRENSSCAFTQKVRKFALLMVDRGHEVIVYGDPRHDKDVGTEYVACYPERDTAPEFTATAWRRYNLRASLEIDERIQTGDFIGLMGGNAQRAVADELSEHPAVEYGIGYGGSFAKFKVFESYAWMHTTYGSLSRYDPNSCEGSFYDTVIPAFLEPDEFKPVETKKDYLLYVGRLTARKGVRIAEQVAKALDMELKIAGEGDYEPEYGTLLGKVGPAKRAKLMAEAQALLAPTTYVEPFGTVAIEAMMSGTPAITTDWGAFTETVIQGVTGYRCRTLGEFIWAAKNAPKLNKKTLIDYAIQNFSMEAVGPQYETYFEQLGLLNQHGWGDESWAGIKSANRFGVIQPGSRAKKRLPAKSKRK